MKKFCSIYKSPRKEEMYLYVDKTEGLERVPEVLLNNFGDPILVTHMMLTPKKKLARADVLHVIHKIDEQGFYLQMPPLQENYLAEMLGQNQKLGQS